ncbi:MAG: SDR family oxidoreductase [Brevefilum sp.]|nr:SDR family oxidoreductase [Brevefilum sp.]
MNENILIVGATGKTGRIIVQKMLDRGDQPRVFVRDQALAENLFGGNVQAIIGDVRQNESLLPAMDGIDTVISAIGSRTPVGKNCPKRVDYQGVENMVQAAVDAGVRRFILISSIAVTKPGHPMNCFGKVLEYKLKGEDILRNSGMDYLVIRPGGLKDTAGGKKSLILDQGDHIMGTISRSDVAALCLFALDYPGELRLTFEAVESDDEGPQNLADYFSSLARDETGTSLSASMP